LDPSAAPASLESILVTDALSERAPRPPDLQAEIDAFHALARQMASRPDDLLNALVRAAVRLCRAGSAGVSLLERDAGGKELFRWVALAGAYAGNEGGTTPRDFSPCGTCLDRKSPQLYSYPARRFTYFNAVSPPMVEGLVLPFGTEMPVYGTIWIASHDESRRFDSEDVRVMTALADFTAAALRLSTTAEANAKLCRSLQEADRRKDGFLATLAHELRNPLAPVRNAVEVLRQKGPPEPELVWARGVIDRQVRQMSHLIDDLLDVSRIALNKLALHRERLLLETVVQGAVEMSRPVIERHGHELAVSVPPEPIVLDADVTRLAQVFSNLLNNAAKYSDPGGHIRLTAVREGSDAVVSVRDGGIGIPADKLPHVFEMYAQVEAGLERSQGGLGIGLALARQLVAMHGGSIEARSDGPGHGSEFVVRLPIDVAAQARQDGGVKKAEQRTASGLRILVVDDNRDAADSLGMLLRVTGNEPRTAYDGAEAVAVAGEFRPDVVLLDIGLPKLNGYEVARRVRQEGWGKGMVLIALTGWGQDEDRRRSREAGFDSHMVKPVEITALMTVLADLQHAGA
jgi:signal transduction histidine kinase/ActR/RegA family two-component response regulator